MTGSTLTHAYIGDVVKFHRNDDGDLVVYGKAAGPDKDLDGQRCHPDWLRKAVPKWFEWGNVREQHDQIAAGVGTDLDNLGDDWHIKAVVTDPVTAHKVETKTLKGWSLGAVGVRTFRDAQGQEWLVDGEIVEFSLVDRPCNSTCTVGVAVKSADGKWTSVAASAGEVIAKAVQLDKPRGGAGSQKSITGEGDPAPAFDRALALSIAAAVMKKDRAGALKLAAPLTTKAVAADGLQDEAPDIATGKEVIRLLGQLIAAEAAELSAGYLDETCDITLLTQATDCIKWWLRNEQAAEDEPEAPYADDDEDDTTVVYIGLSARGVVFKYVSQAKRDEYAKSGVAMPNGDFPIPDTDHLKSAVGHLGNYQGDKAEAKAHIIKRAKALGATNLLPDDWGVGGSDSKEKAVDPETGTTVEPTTEKTVTTQTSSLDEAAVQKIADAAVVKALAPLQAENVTLREELAQIKSTAIPGGPFVVAPPAGANGNDAATKAAGYREIAKTATDPALREAYNALAAREEAAARR